MSAAKKLSLVPNRPEAAAAGMTHDHIDDARPHLWKAVAIADLIRICGASDSTANLKDSTLEWASQAIIDNLRETDSHLGLAEEVGNG